MRRKNKDRPGEVIELQAVGRPDSSRRGDASEAAFVARACGFDFRVAKPWGNRDPYDVLVGVGQEFWRVQVKCTSYYNGNAYWIKGRGRAGHYSKDVIDFLAAHVVPEDVWYIVPVEAFADVSAITIKESSRTAAHNYRPRTTAAAAKSKTSQSRSPAGT